MAEIKKGYVKLVERVEHASEDLLSTSPHVAALVAFAESLAESLPRRLAESAPPRLYLVKGGDRA